MEEVEQQLGVSKVTPGPDGENIDLGYVACLLRLIDFAHIDCSRAPKLQRRLRPQMTIESTKHWDAQENITGPVRDDDFLVYGCTQPINEINAWWLLYDTATLLDGEIRSVHEYLRNRVVSKERFSLRGVKAVETPSAFKDYVRLAGGIVPIDIRVQPDSMERIVELLGGPQIYGPDELAPIRELIQNARDAIHLRYAVERAEGHAAAPGEISIKLHASAGQTAIEVADNGVGMTMGVVRKHLVGVGSDFWNSLEFYSQYRKALDAGFRPIGKFGIGFLSVFMLGTHIEVETEARTSNKIKLSLDGLGKRGELREIPSTGRTGTVVRVTLKKKHAELFDHLADVVRARAPMLDIPITVQITQNDSNKTERIEPDWWKRVPIESLIAFARDWRSYSYSGKPFEPRQHPRYDRYDELEHYGPSADFGGRWAVKGWPGAKPQVMTGTGRVLCQGGEPSPGVIVCSQGVAVSQIAVPDVVGIVELGPVELNVSRVLITDRGPRRRDTPSRVSEIGMRVSDSLKPAVIERMDELAAYGMIPGRISFIRGLALVFGPEVLHETKLQWIPVFMPPGNLILHSKQELFDYLKGRSRLSLCIGAGISGTYSVASSHIPNEDISQMTIVSVSREEIEVGYEAKKRLERGGFGDVISGPLDQLLQSITDAPPYGRPMGGRTEDLVLTNFLLRCIADSWKMKVETLVHQKWYIHYSDNLLFADLRRVGS